jgi:AcrR family transcriptional regulator
VSSDVKARALPKGRHNLPRQAVRASQRERLLDAMLASVAERGFAATTVPQVVAGARVSRNAFYALFRDKTDCFLALCDELAGDLLEQLFALRSDDWADALRTGTALYLRFWEERPAIARTYFVELPAAGPRALEQRDRQYERFRDLYEQLAAWARAQHPELAPLPRLVPRMLVVAITELIAEEVRAGRTDRLSELEDELVELMLRLLA